VLAKNLKKDELEAAISAALADEKLFAAVTPGRPVRFPVTRATYAPEPSELAAAPAVLVLSTVDASFAKNKPHDDHLRLLSASGSELWSHGGLTRTQAVGGAHCVAVDPARKRIYVCENLADRITAFNLGGQKLWQIDQVPADMLAIDEATGNLWTSGGGRLNEGETVVFDPQGHEVLAIPYRALDIAYNPYDDAFWIAGYDMLKLNRKGDVLFKKHVDGWCYASVAPNPTNGTVWITEHDHPDIASSKNRLWQLNADGSVRRKIELDKYEISVVRCALKTGDAWIAAYGGKLRRVPVVGEPGPPLPIEAKSISISPTSGEIWVTTKEAVLRLDPLGKVLATSPFDKPSLQSWLQAF